MKKIKTIFVETITLNDRNYEVYYTDHNTLDMLIAPWAQEMWIRFTTPQKTIYDNTHLRGVNEEIILHDFNVSNISEIHDAISSILIKRKIQSSIETCDMAVVQEKPKRRM